MADSEVSAIPESLLSKALFVRSKSRSKVFSNPDDGVLGTVAEREPDFIVTGDKHKLELKEFKGIRNGMVKSVHSIVDGRR